MLPGAGLETRFETTRQRTTKLPLDTDRDIPGERCHSVHTTVLLARSGTWTVPLPKVSPAQAR